MQIYALFLIISSYNLGHHNHSYIWRQRLFLTFYKEMVIGGLLTLMNFLEVLNWGEEFHIFVPFWLGSLWVAGDDDDKAMKK